MIFVSEQVNSQFAGQGDVQVEARAPGGRVHNLRTVYRNGDYIINFTPSEVGTYGLSPRKNFVAFDWWKNDGITDWVVFSLIILHRFLSCDFTMCLEL